jgi:hypothetical protein
MIHVVPDHITEMNYLVPEHTTNDLPVLEQITEMIYDVPAHIL